MITLTGKSILKTANHNDSQQEFTPNLAVSKSRSLRQSAARLKANLLSQPARKLEAGLFPGLQGSKGTRVLFLMEEG